MENSFAKLFLLVVVVLVLIYSGKEDDTPVFPENPVSNVVDIKLGDKKLVMRTIKGTPVWKNESVLLISNRTGHDIDGLTLSYSPNLFQKSNLETLLTGRYMEFVLPEINFNNEAIIVVGAQGHDPVALYLFKDAQGELTLVEGYCARRIAQLKGILNSVFKQSN